MSGKLLFTREEFGRRLATVQAAMEARGTDLLLLDQPETIFYLLGYAMSEGLQQFCIVPRGGLPVMVLRSVDSGTCRDYSWIDDIVGYADWDDPIAVVADLIDQRDLPAARVGIDENSYNMTLLRFRQLQQAFTDSEFVDYSDLFVTLRARKSAREIEYLRRASQIADQALLEIIGALRPGDSARDCVALATHHVIRLGGDASVVGPVTKALDDSKMHALLDDDPLTEGDLLHVELIPQYMGYGARLMRPVHIGQAPESLIDKARRIVALQDRQFAVMRPGVPACEVDGILRDEMLREGLKQSYPNITGYSLGYYQLFTCRSSDFSYIFRPTDTWTLQPGMVFHMYTAAGGLAFSETIQVTEDGADRLTRTRRELLQSGMDFEVACA